MFSPSFFFFHSLTQSHPASSSYTLAAEEQTRCERTVRGIRLHDGHFTPVGRHVKTVRATIQSDYIIAVKKYINISTLEYYMMLCFIILYWFSKTLIVYMKALWETFWCWKPRLLEGVWFGPLPFQECTRAYRWPSRGLSHLFKYLHSRSPANKQIINIYFINPNDFDQFHTLFI